MAVKFTSVDEYIDSFPHDVQAILKKVRRTIHDVVPEATDKISYQIPAVSLGGKPLLYYSGWQKHVSLYPIPETDEALDQELAPYKSGKGTLKFPLAQPIPYDLIGRVAAVFASRARRRHASPQVRAADRDRPAVRVRPRQLQ